MTRQLLLRTAAAVVAIVLAAGLIEVLHRTQPSIEGAAPQLAQLEPVALDELLSCERLIGEEAIEEEAREEAFQAGRLTSVQLLECPDAFDGLRISYVGEVVGNLLPRDDGAWAQVNDDRYALEVGPLFAHDDTAGYNSGMGVWLPPELAARVGDTGGPDRRGDVVAIEGIFQRADPRDGAGVTIRAESLEVLAPAVELGHPLHVAQAVTAAGAAVLAALALLHYRHRAAQR